MAENTTNSVQEYTSDTIHTFENLESVRYRPTFHLGSTDSGGQCHMISELIANSADEISVVGEGTVYIGVLRRPLETNDHYQIFVVDNGRGIPAKRLEAALAKLGTSGKTGRGSAYRATAGQFGQGGKVATALSTRYRAISKNATDNLTGDLYLENAVIKHSTVTENVDIPYGTAIAFEPDLEGFFTEGDVFMASGYLDLVALCRKVNIFNPNINFQFYLYDYPLPEEYWSADTTTARNILNDYILSSSKKVEYAADQVTDKSSYLFDLWRVTSDIMYRTNMHRSVAIEWPAAENQRIADYRNMSYDIKLFLTKNSGTGYAQYYISLNGVTLRDKTDNTITQTFMRVLRERIAALQPVPEHGEFVKEQYRFGTLLLAIGVSSDSCEFSGSTKSTYTSNEFGAVFTQILNAEFDAHPEIITTINEVIASDIVSKYNQTYGSPQKKKDNNCQLRLNYQKNFKDCKCVDPLKRELFIVEGASASVVRVRDNEYQAIYETKGKPVNGAISNNRKECLRHLLRDPVYQDLMEIINVNEHTIDLSSLRFGKIIIATDADADGYHIRSLHIHNLYLINPRLIDAGIVWLANPPLYAMYTGSRQKIFLRDDRALYDARIMYLYRPALDIAAAYDENGEIKPLPMSSDAYRECCWMTHHFGDLFSSVADELAVPLLVLERLVFAINMLIPRINYDRIAEAFESNDPEGHIKVRVDKEQGTIIVSIGAEDHHIVLNTVGYIIRDRLLSAVKKIRYNDLRFIVTNKFTGESKVMSMMQLYLLLKSMNDICKIERFKGLGELTDQDCRDSVMNPLTRSMTHIVTTGDAAEAMAVCKDSAARKNLLMDSSTLSYKFAKDNRI